MLLNQPRQGFKRKLEVRDYLIFYELKLLRKKKVFLKVKLKAAVVAMGIIQNKWGFYSDTKEGEILVKRYK